MFPKLSLALAAIAAGACAQQTFEVASIKPNAANDHRVMIGMQPGGRFTATGVTLKMLMEQAYDVREFQIAGGPGWVGTDRFDIVAKAEGASERMPMEQLRPMIRALIEERFELKVKREAKEMPVYALVVGKNGSRLQASTDGERMMRMGRGQLTAKRAKMEGLAALLARQVGRSVVDKTGLTGEYDFTLEWTPEPGQGGGPFAGPPGHDAPPPTGGEGPSIFTAVQEQLGLRLDSQKGPVETLAIDHVAKPSEN